MDMPQKSPRVPPMLEIMSTALTVAVLPFFEKESKMYERYGIALICPVKTLLFAVKCFHR